MGRQFFKTAINILVISNHNSFPVVLDIIASAYPYILFEKYIYIFALEMANYQKINLFTILTEKIIKI